MSAAVLDVHGAHSVVWRPGQRGGRLQRHPRDFGALVALLRELEHHGGAHQLWITQRWLGAHPIADWPRDALKRPVAWFPVPGGVSGYAIVAPHQNARLAPYAATSDGQVLADALECLASGLGTRVEGTPGQTAGKLLMAQLARRGLADEVFPDAELPTVLEHPIAWSRELLPHERELPWLLAVDRRTAYLHSMELAELGTGQPEHVTDTERQLVVLKAPGFFHCRLRRWTDELLPDPLARAQVAEEWCWLTGPGLLQAIGNKLLLDIDEAWQWPKRSRVLLPVAAKIRSALERAAAAPPAVAEVAVPILKAAYQQLHGRLRMPRDTHRELFRPDWYATVLADCRERSYRTAQQLRDADLAPVGSLTDCWYVPSERRELPAVCNPKHWQLKAAVPMAALDADTFADPGTLAQRVNAAARGAR